MTKFYYTQTADVDSSAVDEVYYNANSKELAVDLHDEVYVYQNVPKARYEALVNADSVGRAFREVKRDYGPSEYLGYCSEVDYVPTREAFDAVDMASVGTPKALTYAENAKVDGVRVSGSGSTSTGTLLTLSVPERNKSRVFAVEFESGDKVRTHTLSAESFGAAEQAVLNIGAMLDLEFNVKVVRVVE